MATISEASTDVIAPKPDDIPWISPYLTVKDAAAALTFYEAAFGFKRQFALPDQEGRIAHATMAWNDGVIMLGPEGAYGGTTLSPASGGFESPVTLYVYSDDVDALFARAEAAGARVHFPPTDMFWGDRMGKLTDPDGHVWNFATRKAIVEPPSEHPPC